MLLLFACALHQVRGIRGLGEFPTNTSILVDRMLEAEQQAHDTTQATGTNSDAHTADVTVAVDMGTTQEVCSVRACAVCCGSCVTECMCLLMRLLSTLCFCVHGRYKLSLMSTAA